MAMQPNRGPAGGAPPPQQQAGGQQQAGTQEEQMIQQLRQMDREELIRIVLQMRNALMEMQQRQQGAPQQRPQTGGQQEPQQPTR